MIYGSKYQVFGSGYQSGGVAFQSLGVNYQAFYDCFTTVVADDCLADNTGDWTAVDASLVFDTDHYNIVYAAATQHIHRTEVAINGKTYRLSIQVKNGTASGISGYLQYAYVYGASQANSVIYVPFTTTADWQTVSGEGEARQVFSQDCDIVNIAGLMVGAGNIQIRNILLEVQG